MQSKKNTKTQQHRRAFVFKSKGTAILKFVSVVLLGVCQSTFASFYDGEPYANKSQITAEAWVDGIKLYNANSVKKRYHVTEEQINCILKPTPHYFVNEIDKYIRSLLSEQSVQTLNDFYDSNLGKLYLTRHHHEALKNLGFIPEDIDTRLPTKEGREVLNVLHSKPMSIILNLNKDYQAVGFMKAYALDMKIQCQLFELTPK